MGLRVHVLFRPRSPVGIYIDVIITCAAQHQRIDTGAVVGIEVKAITIPAERNPAAFAQHDGLFLAADATFSFVRHNGNHAIPQHVKLSKE
jgi:hypothetical protein